MSISDLKDEDLPAQLPPEVVAAITDRLDEYHKAETDDGRAAILRQTLIDMGHTFFAGYELGFKDGTLSLAGKNILINPDNVMPNRAMRRATNHRRPIR